MLIIKELRKAYGKHHALNGLDMEIAGSTLYGFVGPNGAGKTTTIKIMAGLLKPDSGSVEIDGQSVLHNPREMKRKIGYVPDNFGVYDNLKVSEYMEFFSSCYGLEGLKARKRNTTLLAQVGLGEKTDFYVDSLSRGMKQRLCLARAMIHDPQLLVMDEPTSGLDPRTRLEFRELVKDLQEQGKTILISSHQLSELSELCSHMGVIDQGKMVIQGSIEEITGTISTSKPLIITVVGKTERALQLLKKHRLVRTITVRDQDIMVNFAGDADGECELLAMLVEAGVAVRGFLREPGSLEAVFMQITNREKERVVLSYEDDESGL